MSTQLDRYYIYGINKYNYNMDNCKHSHGNKSNTQQKKKLELLVSNH